ncbi:MAG: hypothetical protein JXQ75_01300 [Phycisphaerae bacterium]|nr:hypothetical protein [Phycisphaerae bacterium]
MRPFVSKPWLVLTCTVVAFAAGCGPSKLLSVPADMPDRFGDRVLWHTPRAYIFAADKAVAGEADRWIGDLAAHVRRAYHADLGKGLVIVVDKGESPCVASYDDILRLQRATATAGGANPEDLPAAAEQRRKLAESGMSEELACCVTPVALDDSALAEIGLGDKLPDDVAWRICCPSHRMMEAGVWEFAPTAVEKKKGKAFAVMTVWAWPLAFPEAAKVFRLARDTLVFELWCIRQPDWPAEKRAAEVASYTKERAFVISPTLSLALSIAKSQE